MTNQEYLTAVYSLGFTLWDKGGIRAVAPIEASLDTIVRVEKLDAKELQKTPVADAKVEGFLTLLAARSAQTDFDPRVSRALATMESQVKSRS